MKFVAKAPREGINVSEEHPLKEASTLILSLSAIFVLIVVALIFFMDLVILLVSPEAEARMFSSWTPLGLEPAEIDDTRTGATRALLERLALHWPESPYTLRLEVTEADSPNAMALPGGLIVVTTGLLDRMATENEFAFVLSHELGHFRNRDHLRGLGRGIALSILLTAIGSNESGANLGLAIADLTLRGFTREQESEADAFGLELVHAEYGHVHKSWRFFDRLNSEGSANRGLIVYLGTHPAAEDRVDRIKEYATEQGWPLDGPTRKLDW